MANILEARVKQKKDTLANWEANPMILLDGEQVFVVSDSGQPVNFKIGDGTKRFSELPYWIQYDQAAFIPVSGLALPAPTQPVGYSILGEGVYTHDSGGFTVPVGHWGVANWDGSAWSFSDMGELPAQPADGVIALNNTGATSGDTVFKSLSPINAAIIGGSFPVGDTDFTDYTTNNTQEYTFLLRQHPVEQNGVINSLTANFHRGGDFYVYILSPTGSSEQQFEYTYKSNSVLSAVTGDNVFTLGIDVEVGDVIGIGQVPGGALLKTKNETNGLWLDAVPDRPLGSVVNFSNSNRVPSFGYELTVGGISGDINALSQEVADLGEEVGSSMKESDLTIEPSINMFNPEKIVSGKYVSNTGSVASNASFACILINVENIADGEDITINGFNTASVATPAYWAFYTTDNPATFGLPNLIEGSNDMFTSNPQTFQKPAGAVGLAINILRTNQTASVYANATINIGTTPISYQPFTGDTITKYKDYNFAGGGGGESYDQSLNTTDNVEFNSVITHALLAELPEGAGSPPAGVLIGQAWIDTTDDSIKVRRV